MSGAGGIRTPTGQVKSLLCCRYTTTPNEGVVPFVRKVFFHHFLLSSLLKNGDRHLARLLIQVNF